MIELLSAPISGRILLRQYASLHVAVGILHFNSPFIEPLKGYGMVTGKGTIQIIPESIHDRPAEHMKLQGADIEGFLRAPIWMNFELSEQLGEQVQGVLARFIEAFPDQHGWLMMSVFKGKPLWLEHRPSVAPNRNVWFDVKAGKLSPIAQPVDADGKTLSRLVAHHVIWPDCNGVLHALCANEAQWRDDYLRQAHLFADVGDGLISMQEAQERIEKDERLTQIATQPLDAHYVHFLAALRAAGGLIKMRPMDKTDFEDRRERLESAMSAIQARRTNRSLCA